MGGHACATGGYLTLKQRRQEPPAKRYQYLFRVPGEVVIQEIGCLLRVMPVPAGYAIEGEPGTLLNADLIGPELRVRNWEPGDRYQPAYSGSEQKLKRLFHERRISAEERASWPVVLQGEEIIWVRGLAVADSYCWRPGGGEALSLQWAPVTDAEGLSHCYPGGGSGV